MSQKFLDLFSLLLTTIHWREKQNRYPIIIDGSVKDNSLALVGNR